MKESRRLQEAIEICAKAHGIDTTKDFAFKIFNPGFMPLTLERWGDAGSVTHYYEQNGDLVPDPDVRYEVIGGKLYPVEFQNSMVYFDHHENEAGQKDLAEFCDLWGENIISQGFADSALTVKIFD